MKKQLFILISFILLSGVVFGQPGYIRQSVNLNNLLENDVSLNQQHPDIYLLSIIIDETTIDFSKLDLLKNHKEIVFDIRTEHLPKEFNTVVFDSINKVYFSCNDITTDLSNIKGFKKAKEINIHNFAGTKIPKSFRDFFYLESLHFQESKNINNIDALKNVESLRFVTIDCNSLKAFPVFNQKVKISHIKLNGVHNNLDLKNLNTLQKLGGVEITIPDELKEFPDYLSKNLKQIRISGNVLSVSNLTFYPNLEYIRIATTNLESLDVDFNGNTSIKNIGIFDNPKLKNIDAVYSCKGLEFLSLTALPALEEFDLKNLNLKQGLSISETGIKTIKPIERLEKLPKLYIKYNDYLKIDIDKKGPKRDIFSNGKLVK